MILIGTSGFHYDDWRGEFYPEGTAKRDFLPFYAGCFPALELNSSYYAIPSPNLVRSLTVRTPDGFQVVVKAFRGITHERGAESLDHLGMFLRAVEPLREAGRLAAILFQFPHSFHLSDEALAFLDSLLAETGQQPAVVEFRSAEWLRESVWRFLRERDTALCCVDEPRLPGLVPPEVVRTSEKIAYVRFHGRNESKWWKHDEAWERYDYLYTRDELGEWLKGIRWLDDNTEKTFIFFNNHRNGQAVLNARDMATLLGVALPGGDTNRG